jgi:hypothetical protein
MLVTGRSIHLVAVATTLLAGGAAHADLYAPAIGGQFDAASSVAVVDTSAPARAHGNSSCSGRADLSVHVTGQQRFAYSTAAGELTNVAFPIRHAPVDAEAFPSPLEDRLAGPDEVRELPGLPGSATLYLSAMISIGGWYAMRSAGAFTWAMAPAGYRAAAAPPMDGAGFVEFYCSCELWDDSWHIDAAGDPLRVVRYAGSDENFARAGQCGRSVETPRGPPLSS